MKKVLGAFTYEERKTKENELHSELILKYIKPMITNLLVNQRVDKDLQEMLLDSLLVMNYLLGF